MITEPQIYGFIESYDEWIYEEGKLKATYEFESFLEAVAFVNDITEVVEHIGVFPKICLEYHEVSFVVWTEAEKRVTSLDIELVKGIIGLLE